MQFEEMADFLRRWPATVLHLTAPNRTLRDDEIPKLGDQDITIYEEEIEQTPIRMKYSIDSDTKTALHLLLRAGPVCYYYNTHAGFFHKWCNLECLPKDIKGFENLPFNDEIKERFIKALRRWYGRLREPVRIGLKTRRGAYYTLCDSDDDAVMVLEAQDGNVRITDMPLIRRFLQNASIDDFVIGCINNKCHKIQVDDGYAEYDVYDVVKYDGRYLTLEDEGKRFPAVHVSPNDVDGGIFNPDNTPYDLMIPELMNVIIEHLRQASKRTNIVAKHDDFVEVTLRIYKDGRAEVINK